MSLPSEQIIAFYSALFERVFIDGMDVDKLDRLKAKAVRRQVEEVSDAASQTLSRFFVHQQYSNEEALAAIQVFDHATRNLTLDDVAHPNANAEELTLKLKDCVAPLMTGPRAAVHRLAFQSVIRDLLLAGPVMAEWQKLAFSSEFEMPRKVVARLNQTNRTFESLGDPNLAAADERFELSYRDYLLQRFYWVEAGTVRMTTNLPLDLRELFVQQYVLPLALQAEEGSGHTGGYLGLAAARESFRQSKQVSELRVPAVDQVRQSTRNVLIGVPGSGKSTFLEWLQVMVASGEEVMMMGGEQAIPILLRVRHLDARNLPEGARIIELATSSKDRAAVMPAGWIERQMQKGRVLLILDGLDEMDPQERDGYVLPWLTAMCERYPQCSYLVSSRPVGYPPGTLQKLNFIECRVEDFDEDQIAQYAQHWCTAVRLAGNELDEEARRAGKIEGEEIVDSFRASPYIRDLARTPLMLSAICLVKYFEKGELPTDRALLYGLCVEGLLHNWDKRRGISSEFALSDKLQACREVAIAMHADDRAEYEAEKVEQIFEQVFQDREKGRQLLRSIRNRAGLLVERRPGVFAFSHLTFQEYLAASAVFHSNFRKIDAERLALEAGNPRWSEVIPLYCGSTPAPVAIEMIDQLSRGSNEGQLEILGEAFLASPRAVREDAALRASIIERLCAGPGREAAPLDRLPELEVAPVANRLAGVGPLEIPSGAFGWLRAHPTHCDMHVLLERMLAWRSRTRWQIAELSVLLHAFAGEDMVRRIADEAGFYSGPGPEAKYPIQADLAVEWLLLRRSQPDYGSTAAMVRALPASSLAENVWTMNGDMFQRFVPVAPEDRERLRAAVRDVMRAMRLRPRTDYLSQLMNHFIAWDTALGTEPVPGKEGEHDAQEQDLAGSRPS